MKTPAKKHLALYASGILACFSGTAGAAIYMDGFDADVGTQNGSQHDTTLALQHSADYVNWSITAGPVSTHVDLNTLNAGIASGPYPNPSNWAAMLFSNQVLTSNATIAANIIGQEYTVDFIAGAAGYQAFNQRSQTANGNGLRIDVIDNDGAGAIIGTYSFFDVDFDTNASALDLGLSADSFTYTGSGNADVRLVITGFGSGVFQGTIDDISIADPSAPRIASFTATPSVLGDAGEAVTFDWLVSGVPLNSLVITPGDIDVLGNTDGAGEGSFLLDPGPDGTTKYTLTAGKDDERFERKVTVTLPAPEIVSFEIMPTGAGPGDAAMFSWEVGLPVTTLMLTPGDIDLLPHTDAGGIGSFTLASGPDEPTTYTLTATRGTSMNMAFATRTIIDPNAIFFEDFNGLDPASSTGNIGFQHTTTFSIANFASDSGLAGWTGAGAGAVTVVDTANWSGNTGNPRNSAVMIWHGGPNAVAMDNVIAGSNDLGVEYQVAFLVGGAVFFDGSQFNDPALNDSVVIDLLRGDDSVLSSHSEVAPEVVGLLDLGFEARSFTYRGDGSGDIKFRVTGSGDAGHARFYGTIDELSVAPVDPAPFQITDIVRDPQTLAVTITFDSIDGAIYEVWGSADLQRWHDLDDSVLGIGDSTQFTDSIFAPANLRYYYQVRRP